MNKAKSKSDRRIVSNLSQGIAADVLHICLFAQRLIRHWADDYHTVRAGLFGTEELSRREEIHGIDIVYSRLLTQWIAEKLQNSLQSCPNMGPYWEKIDVNDKRSLEKSLI